VLSTIDPVTITLLVGATAVLVLVLKRLWDANVTREQLSAIILLLLGVSVAFGTAGGYELLDRTSTGAEYNVEVFEGGPDDRSEEPYQTVLGVRMGGPYDFEHLSPEAQDVFLSALESDGVYTTRANPTEFHDDSDPDVGGRGYVFVEYDSTWYKVETLDNGGDSSILLFLVALLCGGAATLALVSRGVRELPERHAENH